MSTLQRHKVVHNILPTVFATYGEMSPATTRLRLMMVPNSVAVVLPITEPDFESRHNSRPTR